MNLGRVDVAFQGCGFEDRGGLSNIPQTPSESDPNNRRVHDNRHQKPHEVNKGKDNCGFNQLHGLKISHASSKSRGSIVYLLNSIYGRSETSRGENYPTEKR
jgi:hypothetical protein